MEDPGREGDTGRPMKWDALVVSYEIQAMTFVMVRFRDPSGATTRVMIMRGEPRRCHYDEEGGSKEEEEGNEGGVKEPERGQDEGGPMKWDAQVSYETRTMTNVVVHFLPSIR
jgi:hypothetical protein